MHCIKFHAKPHQAACRIIPPALISKLYMVDNNLFLSDAKAKKKGVLAMLHSTSGLIDLTTAILSVVQKLATLACLQKYSCTVTTTKGIK